MRKFWTFLTVALVALGAVACDDKIEEEDVTPTVVDKISFTASVEDMTRTYLQQDGEIYHTKWVGDEQLCVHTIDNYSEKFYFSNSKSKPNSFYCEAEGVGKLLNQKVVITYVKDIVSIDSDTYTIDSSAGATGVLLTANTTLTEDAQITMRAECAYLLYSSSAEVTFTAKQTGGERNLFAKGGVGVSTITLPGGNGIFVPIAAYDKAEGNAAYELSYSIGGAEGKSTTITPEWNKIYDLGVLTPTETPDVPTPSATSVYLVPGVWNVDNAWFAAYFFDANGGNSWFKMEDANTDGIFECTVPTGMTNVIFCRMNPAFADCGWSSDTEQRVWNQSADLSLPIDSANHYYITGWESGEWHEAGYTLPETPETPTPDTPTLSDADIYFVPGVWNVDDAWFAAYFFDANGGNCWLKLEDANTDGIFECKVPVDMTSVIFCRMNPAFADCGWNSGDEETTGAPKRVWNQTGDNTVGVAPANYFYITGWGTDEQPNSPGEWHEAGYTLPETPDTPGTPDLTDAVIYLVPNADWKSDSAWFAAHFYNETDGYADVKMEDADGDGIYECKVPAAMTNVLFCRMNPAYETFGWNSETENDHVWNQTEGSAVGVTPNNYFYITDWGKGEWHEAGYTLPETPDTPVTPDLTDAAIYLVPGVWAADNARFAVYETATERWTDMTAVEGKFGLYSAKVATSDIVFVRMSPTDSANVWENKWNQTADLVVPTDEKNCYYITGWGTEEQPNSPGEWKAYVNIEWAVGGTFTEDNWKSEKKMTLVSTSVYKLADLTLKAYDEFKIKSAGSWDTNYGVSSFSFFTPGHWQSAVLNGGNICVDAAGTYDIYFDQEELRIYVVAADSDYTAATEQTVEGTAPEVEGDAKYLYLKPNSNWLVDNARFAAYFFDNGERWVSMTDSDGDGIYEVVVPADKNFPKVIFCRMNPNAAANNWSNKWNQTDDLTIPTNGNNLYTVKDGTWDKGGGTWSKK